jgi:hypothetical protein
MYFKTLHRVTFAQAPEGTAYEVGDEVIVETTYDSETYRSSLRIVGPAVPKEQTPSPEAFRVVSQGIAGHLNAAFSAAGAGLAEHVRVGDKFGGEALSRLVEEANYTLRGKGLVIFGNSKPNVGDDDGDEAIEFIVKRVP